MKTAGKLIALLAIPLLIIFSIYASGVYYGATRADRVVELEQRWLGIEPPPGRLLASNDAGAGDDEGGEPSVETPPSEPEEPEPDKPEPEQPEPETPEPKPEPEQPEVADGLPVAKADPVGPELRQRFEEARVVDVLIMVDPALVVARQDWLGYIASLFESTRASFEVLFGIDLQLHGVIVWDDAVGADADRLLEDLAAREREGADMVIGLLAREQPHGFAPARWTGEHTGDHALVFADLAQSDRYYRNLLRALALLFGAEPTNDSASKQLGSFMSDAAPRADAGPTLDPENRGLVIINKRRPIAEPKPVEPESNPDEPTDESIGEGEE